MLGLRTAFGVVGTALVLVTASACGGSAVRGDGAGGAGETEGGAPASGATTSGGFSPARGGGGAFSAGTAQGGSATVDPPPVESGCPEADLPPPDLQCDPFAVNACGAGFGCYPFVDHPEGNGCEQQRYGTVCSAAGLGTQGDSCGDEAGDCASGFVCVVGQRAGKRCAALCKLGQANPCGGGLVCGDLDVAGFGVCG